MIDATKLTRTPYIAYVCHVPPGGILGFPRKNELTNTASGTVSRRCGLLSREQLKYFCGTSDIPICQLCCIYVANIFYCIAGHDGHPVDKLIYHSINSKIADAIQAMDDMLSYTSHVSRNIGSIAEQSAVEQTDDEVSDQSDKQAGLSSISRDEIPISNAVGQLLNMRGVETSHVHPCLRHSGRKWRP